MVISSSIAGTSLTTLKPISSGKPKAVNLGFGIAARRNGCRTPAIEKKLMELYKRVEKKDGKTVFNLLRSEDAIDVLGNYNPIYGGVPKKLAEFLLKGTAGQTKVIGMFSLLSTGLFYQTPILIGVRGHRMLTSYAGLELLRHWVVKFPKFKPFFEAYASKEIVDRITCDCFDLANGHTPKWMEEEFEKNRNLS